MNENFAAQAGLLVGERYRPLSGRSGRARRATSTLFLVDGMTFGTWAALIPSFQQKFSLSEAQLSLVLLGLVVGALISMPLTGRMITGWGSRAIAFPAALAFCCALTLLALAPNYSALVAAALLFGALKGAVDVSINAQAITVENAIGKPIMSSFQAFWSFGGLAAAFFLSLAMNRGFSSGPLMLTMAVVFLVLTLSTSGRLLPDRSPSRGDSPGFSLPDSKLLRLGGLAFLALFSEGVLLDWSAVYARSVANMSLATAPMAFAAFALSMAAGRFVGDYWIGRFGPIAMLRCSGLLMALGVGIAVLLPPGPRCWSVLRQRVWAFPISCRFFSARRAGPITTAPDRGSQP